MALKEGWLWKEGHGSMGHHSWRRRWFILESGTLEYFESPDSTARLGQVLLDGTEPPLSHLGEVVISQNAFVVSWIVFRQAWGL